MGNAELAEAWPTSDVVAWLGVDQDGKSLRLQKKTSGHNNTICIMN